jgi:hypothetical protein
VIWLDSVEAHDAAGQLACVLRGLWTSRSSLALMSGLIRTPGISLSELRKFLTMLVRRVYQEFNLEPQSGHPAVAYMGVASQQGYHSFSLV